jgi:hypothetical protein
MNTPSPSSTFTFTSSYVPCCAVHACMYAYRQSPAHLPTCLPTYLPIYPHPSTPKWQYIASRRAVPISSLLSSPQLNNPSSRLVEKCMHVADHRINCSSLRIYFLVLNLCPYQASRVTFFLFFFYCFQREVYMAGQGRVGWHALVLYLRVSRWKMGRTHAA